MSEPTDTEDRPPEASAPAPRAVVPVVVPRWIQLVTLPLAALALYAVAKAAGIVLLLFITAAVTALILAPLVSLVQRARLPRGIAIFVVLAGFLLTLAAARRAARQPDRRAVLVLPRRRAVDRRRGQREPRRRPGRVRPPRDRHRGQAPGRDGAEHAAGPRHRRHERGRLVRHRPARAADHRGLRADPGDRAVDLHARLRRADRHARALDHAAGRRHAARTTSRCA